jgi:hypothetical protein
MDRNGFVILQGASHLMTAFPANAASVKRGGVSESVRTIPHADCAAFQAAQSLITRFSLYIRFAQLLLADASVTPPFIGNRLKPLVSFKRPFIGAEVLVLGPACKVQSVYFIQHRQGIQSIRVAHLYSKLVNRMSLLLSKSS